MSQLVWYEVQSGSEEPKKIGILPFVDGMKTGVLLFMTGTRNALSFMVGNDDFSEISTVPILMVETNDNKSHPSNGKFYIDAFASQEIFQSDVDSGNLNIISGPNVGVPEGVSYDEVMYLPITISIPMTMTAKDANPLISALNEKISEMSWLFKK